MISVQLPDGKLLEVANDATAMSIARSIGERLANAVIAAKVNDTIVDAARPLAELQAADSKQPLALRLLTEKDPESLGVLRHSSAHIMARAIMRLFPNVSLAFGPTTATGYYYDIDSPHKLSEEDFAAIEKEMAAIVAKAEPFERVSMARDESLALCRDLKQALKVEHIETGLADHKDLSFYRQGEFVDLCRGPHIPDAGKVKAFKLMSLAGAYWKGDASGRQLQRVYGTAFFNPKDQQAFLDQMEEAKRRDHRVLGKRLNLFHIDDMVGQGLILWTPKGAFIRQQLQDFISSHLRRQGYHQVFTPHIGKLDLYKTSGHFPYYQDSQYPPLVQREQLNQLAAEGCSCSDLSNRMTAGEIDGYLLKPMNCPHHIKIYSSQHRSYRDLPLRLAEFGTVYRWEQSGEIGGLTRVRGFTQDDAHLFVTQEQLAGELAGCLELVKIVFAAMGMDDYRVRVGLRDPSSDKYVGDPENWSLAEQACRDAAASLGKPYSEEAGEAAFYGPKIDFVVRDCIGRQWQLGTVQVDYNLPIRFGLEYIGPDNRPHRPIMIHRAPFGSMERFIGVLIEHFAGAFPLWLAPEQVRICPLSEKSNDYAMELQKKMTEAGLRVTTDARGAKVQAKIRDAQLELIPYMAVIGPKEAETNSVALRDRIDGDLGAKPVDEVIAMLCQEVNSKKIRQIAKSSVAALPEPTDGTANEY